MTDIFDSLMKNMELMIPVQTSLVMVQYLIRNCYLNEANAAEMFKLLVNDQGICMADAIKAMTRLQIWGIAIMSDKRELAVNIALTPITSSQSRAGGESNGEEPES